MKGVTTSMVERVEAYLEARRRLGFQLQITGSELLRFARYADDSGHRGPVTTDIALRWAQCAKEAARVYRARRIEMVRTFARHQAVIELATEIPPAHLLGPARRRMPPYVYSEREIVLLLTAAAKLRAPDGLRAETYSSLFGLLACTGLRISEALALEKTDVNFDTGVTRIRETKFRKTRLVPLHPTTTTALSQYAGMRDKVMPRTSSFFVGKTGNPLPYSTVRTVFRKLADSVLDVQSAHRRPRIHDLRHTFACRTLLRWYRAGADVDERIAVLSTYLGHAKVSDTYWYLTGVSELMRTVSDRFERFTLVGEP